MKNRLLIIGNTSANYHVGAMFLRAAKELDLDVKVCDTNLESYAPSMSSILGKVFFKIAGKRPIESWTFNRKVVSIIYEFCPQLIIVTGIFPLQNKVFEASRAAGSKTVNFLTDSPWSKQNKNKAFMSNLPSYDIIFSTKSSLVSNLEKINCNKVRFLPFAFDPFLHYEISHLEDDLNYSDACLIGAADKDRCEFVKSFIQKFKSQFSLYGSFWDTDRYLKRYHRGIVLENDYCKVVGGSKINIGLVRRANSDGHSMRTYEIPACGGVGIYEDTSEHREIFSGYPEYGFFTSPKDLADKCNWLIEHPVELEQMRQLGIRLVVSENNTYKARLKKILEYD